MTALREPFRPGRGSGCPSLLLAGGLLLLLLAGLAYLMWQAQQEAIRSAERATSSPAELFETRVASEFQRLDALLGIAAGEFQPARLSSLSPAERVAQSARLARLIADFPAVAETLVFDANDQLQLSSNPAQTPFNNVDRPHFNVLRDDPRLTSVSSDPLMARSTGKMAFGASAVSACWNSFLTMSRSPLPKVKSWPTGTVRRRL